MKSSSIIKNLVESLAELKSAYDADSIEKEITKNAIQKISNLYTSVLLAEENSSLLNDELPITMQLFKIC